MLVSDNCTLTERQIAVACRVRDRLVNLREEMDEDEARLKAILQAVRLLDVLGLCDVADALEEFI